MAGPASPRPAVPAAAPGSAPSPTGQSLMSPKKILGLLAFLIGVFVLVPMFIAATGRWDFY